MLNFNSYPLDIFKDSTCSKYLLKLNSGIAESSNLFSVDELLNKLINDSLYYFTGSFGIGTLNKIWISVNEKVILKKLASFIKKQVEHIGAVPSDLLSESKINLLVLLSFHGSLTELKTDNPFLSYPTQLRAAIRGLKQLSIDGYFEEKERLEKPIKDYYYNCIIVYHLAFLLHAFRVLECEMEPQISSLIKIVLESVHSESGYKHVFQNKIDFIAVRRNFTIK